MVIAWTSYQHAAITFALPCRARAAAASHVRRRPARRPARPATPRRRRPAQRARVVAVTGAASFLGSNLVGSLEEDDRIGRIVAIDVTPRRADRAPQDALLRGRPHAAHGRGAPRRDPRRRARRHARPPRVPRRRRRTPPRGRTSSRASARCTSLVAARHAQVRKLVLWSQTLLYGAHPTNPNFLTEKHPLRAPRGEPFFADKIDAEAEARTLRAARARHGRHHPADGAHPRADGAATTCTRYLARKRRPHDDGLRPAAPVPPRGRRHRRVQARASTATCPAPSTSSATACSRSRRSSSSPGGSRCPSPTPSRESLAALGWIAQLAEAPPIVPQVPALPLRRRRAARARDAWAFAPRTRRARRCSTSRARSGCAT